MSELVSPPFTYDDERLMYDEACFFFDGDGFDKVCLGLGGGRRKGEEETKKEKERKPGHYIDLVIRSQFMGTGSLSSLSPSQSEEIAFTIKGEIRAPKFEALTTNLKSSVFDIGISSISQVSRTIDKSSICISAEPIILKKNLYQKESTKATLPGAPIFKSVLLVDKKESKS